MINLKTRVLGKERLVCICDSELIGKTLNEGEIHMVVPESFYGDKSVSQEEALIELKKATIINSLGAESLKLVNKVIKVDKVITINGVPHAQVTKL